MSIIHFGAGNIGRGLIYPWLRKYRDDIILIDNNQELVNELKEKNQYTVFDTDSKKTIIYNIDIVHNEDKRIFDLLNNTSIITTSVGVNNLKHVADTIINNIIWNNNIIFICFENSLRGGVVLKEAMLNLANNDINLINKIQTKCTFINGVIDCIVPDINLGLDILTENYSEWYIDLPNNVNLELFNDKNIITYDFKYFIDRKLSLFNIAHWAIAFLGLSKGYEYIYDAWNDKEIFEIVADILNKSYQFLIEKYPNKETDIRYYFKKNVSRFNNKSINDTLKRVARDPARKYNLIKEYFKGHENEKCIKILLQEIEKKL